MTEAQQVKSEQVKNDVIGQAPTEKAPKAEVSKGKGNSMRSIRIVKVTLNVGAGKDESKLKKGLALLGKLATVTPVKTTTKRRIPTWGLRPGLAIGCKVTVREDTQKLLRRLLVAKRGTLKASNFDASGNVSFGIPEYIDIEGLEYDPDLKIMGLEVAVTLERPGYRVKKRRIKTTPVGKSHQITREEAQNFMAETFGLKIE